jgi:hypothetical protein
MRQLNLSIAFSVPSSVQNPKQRHSIFTDQDSAMGNLVEHVFFRIKKWTILKCGYNKVNL